MSPSTPSFGTFSVKNTGRPMIDTGGACAMLGTPGQPPIQIPGDACEICARAGNASIDAIHTADPSEVGSIRAYMLTMFAQVSAVVRAPPAPALTTAGALRNPSGVPTPVSVINARSSNQARARGKFWSKNAENAVASARSSLGTVANPVSFFASRTTRPNDACDSVSDAPSSVQ